MVTLNPTGNLHMGTLKYGTGMNASLEAFHDGVLSVLVTDTRLGDVARVTYPRFSSDLSYDLCTQKDDTFCDHDTM